MTPAQLYVLMREHRDVENERIQEQDTFVAAIRFTLVTLQMSPENASRVSLDDFRLIEKRDRNRRSCGHWELDMPDRPLTPEERDKLKDELLTLTRRDMYDLKAKGEGRNRRLKAIEDAAFGR